MRRLDFITLLGSVAAVLPLMARAQQPATMKRIGVLMGAFVPTGPDGQAALSAFLTTLQALGWTLGNNAQIEVHWIGPEVEHGKAEAAKLVAWAPEVLFCSSSSATRRGPGPGRAGGCRRTDSTTEENDNADRYRN